MAKAKSSIHFRAVKSNSEAHNQRATKLDYVHEGLSKNNTSWVGQTIAEAQKEIEAYCKKTSGRKLQKNAVPIREAVVNLNAHHTLDDLLNLAKVLEAKKGIKCIQIYDHRDEGTDKNNLNYHAHMIFRWQDMKTGKTLRLNKMDMSEIQTIVAEELGMVRGELKENSNTERLEAVAYKTQQELKKLKEIELKVKAAEEAAEEKKKQSQIFLTKKSDDIERLKNGTQQQENETQQQENETQQLKKQTQQLQINTKKTQGMPLLQTIALKVRLGINRIKKSLKEQFESVMKKTMNLTESIENLEKRNQTLTKNINESKTKTTELETILKNANSKELKLVKKLTSLKEDYPEISIEIAKEMEMSRGKDAGMGMSM